MIVLAIGLYDLIRPDILIMDEPLGALGESLRRTLQSELKQLQTRLGATSASLPSL